MNKAAIEKILKNKNNQIIYIILIIGVILLVLSSGGMKSKAPEKKDIQKEEQRLEAILSDINGVGQVSVMITYYEEEKPKDGDAHKAKGAIVTAEGAGKTEVKKALSESVQAALNLPAHKVCIYEKSRAGTVPK